MSTDSDFYSFTVKDADLNDVSMADYKGKVVMIVNVASRCGFTKQYGRYLLLESVGNANRINRRNSRSL